ncbi:hypothetical protein BH11BAC4_BH11BAC4_24370 [soil metagenome]
MKLLQLQATEDTSLLNNTVYQGLVEKFSKLFIRQDPAEKPVFAPVMKEDSQFYKRLVELVGTGVRTKATVLYISETGIRINQDPVVSITVRFYNSKNKMQEIAAKTVVSKIAVPQAADIISIAYSACYPDIVAVL